MPMQPRARRDSLLSALLHVATGAAAALGQAPWGLWLVTLLALALLCWRIARSRTPFRPAFLAGCGYFAASMFWIVEPFLVEPEIYGWMAPFALVLFAAGGGLFWAVPGWLAGRISTGWQDRATGFAAALVLSDWIRGWIFTGLPWALTGHIWIDTPAAQLAALTGSIGLSALTMLAAALPILLWRGPATDMRGALRGSVMAALVIALAHGWGLNRIIAPLPADRDFTLRLVQPNAEQALKWDPYWSQVFFDRLIRLSTGPTADDRAPDAVIWPETAVNFLLERAETAPQEITRIAGAPVLLGIQRSEGSRYFNSFAEFTADGRIGRTYDKFHLVPFGEYTPWGDQLARFGISSFAAQHGAGYSSGTGAQVLRGLADQLPPVQVLICYEAIFSRHLITGPDRPEWILQITNDAWFGTLAGPWQHLAQARLRAIESGLPVIRVANTGVTAVIDARGAVRQSLGLNVEGRIDARLPGALPPTIWSRTRDWPVVIATLLALIVIATRRRKSVSSVDETRPVA